MWELLGKSKLIGNGEVWKPNVECDNDLLHIFTYLLHDFLGLLMLKFSVEEFNKGI